jgi:hypothetical protein
MLACVVGILHLLGTGRRHEQAKESPAVIQLPLDRLDSEQAADKAMDLVQAEVRQEEDKAADFVVTGRLVGKQCGQEGRRGGQKESLDAQLASRRYKADIVEALAEL